ncbi:MAG: DUF4249 family protein [Bacteroidales bacterium]|nr:DUF4249 family protein [Bacteroidales bacterium]
MKSLIDSFFLAIASLLACSCVEYVSLNTEDPREVVVNCILRDTTAQELELFWTAQNDDKGPLERIRQADAVLVRLGSGGEQEVGAFVCGADGIWRLDYRPEAGMTYRLNVSVAGQSVSAETQMPHGFRVETVPNPILIAYPQYVSRHHYPSRQITADDADAFPLLAWFTGENGLVQRVVSSHEQTDYFNSLSECDRILLGVTLWEYNGMVMLVGKPPQDLVESDYIKRPYLDRMAVIAHERSYENNYYYPVTVSFYASSLPFVEISTIINLHPEYGAYEKDWLLWGPNFDIWPAFGETASELHIQRPSAELLAYLKDVVSLTAGTGDADFTQVFSQKTPYTNIRGGRGIFGAATEYVEDYSDYDERMKSFYKTIINNEFHPEMPVL